MLKQENNYKAILEELKNKQRKINELIEEESLNIKNNKKTEKITVLFYEKNEVKEEIEILEKTIKKIEFKEKVEKEYENLLGDGKK